MTELICPFSGAPCDNVRNCAYVNEPLNDIIPETKRNMGGGSANLIQHVLKRAVQTQADLLAIPLPISIKNGSATVCPEAALKSEIGQKFGERAAATGVRNIILKCITQVNEDLKPYRTE